MTTAQTQLIEALAAENITAAFNGAFLNCKVAIKSGKKTKWQRFSFVFDDAGRCDGVSKCGKTSGAYSDALAVRTFELILRATEGDARGDKFVKECQETRGMPRC